MHTTKKPPPETAENNLILVKAVQTPAATYMPDKKINPIYEPIIPPTSICLLAGLKSHKLAG